MHAIRPGPSVHRHGDGAIDIGFYRTTATRHRRRARRAAVRRGAAWIRHGVAAAIRMMRHALAGPWCWLAGLPRIGPATTHRPHGR